MICNCKAHVKSRQANNQMNVKYVVNIMLRILKCGVVP